ncbi:MAG: UvrD-helicase domain-containing protein [Patescibacteria group bacterium]|nr:UvrD-helicase domain-containing protein [Patescibacteria group bacterium]
MRSLYTNLNEKQQRAVENLEGPILIVAGAGSGKTRTLTSRLGAILASGAVPESVVAITFTNKAAEEMKNRVRNIENCKLKIENLFIGTFHSLGARILKKEAKLAGRTPNFSIFDGDDSLRLIKNIVKNLNLPEHKKQREANPLFLRREFSRIKSELSDIEDEDELTGAFFKEYEEALRKNNAFDFDDLIEKPIRIFQNHKDILEKYQKRFRYILVDEFQDTNTAQYVFVKLLAEGHQNLSVVGDDQQSIYKFRGSNFKIFLNFENDWPKTKTVFLEQNYRSSGNIIKAASSVIANNKFQKPKNLWTENPDGDLVRVAEHNGEDEEAEWVTDKIFKYLNIEKFKYENNSVAVLYRTNAQSRAIESALIERGIVYKIFGGVKFYERKEIKDIVAVLRWSFNQNDMVSFERIKTAFLKKPFLEIQNKAPAMAGKLSPAELISYILETGEYPERLKRTEDNFQERIENINELIYFASEFNSLTEFLEKISLFQSGDRGKTNKLSDVKGQMLDVNLMTIHIAKGLEFDEVFIIGCNEGLLPHQMSYHNNEEIEEERRLMYVAMTRAKKNLYLNFYNIPSRFLSEIAPETVEVVINKKGNKYETLSDFLDDEERYIEFD